MSDAVEKLKPALAALSPADRDEVIDYLVGLDGDGSTREEWEASWADEINRRLSDLESGRTQAVPGDEVMRRLREKYG